MTVCFGWGTFLFFTYVDFFCIFHIWATLQLLYSYQFYKLKTYTVDLHAIELVDLSQENEYTFILYKKKLDGVLLVDYLLFLKTMHVLPTIFWGAVYSELNTL